jgi:hypothetical protein
MFPTSKRLSLQVTIAYTFSSHPHAQTFVHASHILLAQVLLVADRYALKASPRRARIHASILLSVLIANEQHHRFAGKAHTCRVPTCIISICEAVPMHVEF